MKKLSAFTRALAPLWIMKQALLRIEFETGYRPKRWFLTECFRLRNRYMNGSRIDIECFRIHVACVADSIIDSLDNGYDNLKLFV